MNHPGKYITRNGKTSKRGAFLNGIWHCDCEPRMPADKFQTKKANNNHGRWFYTCQKAQHKSCSFFLWADEAKVREESAVLNNSRSEPLGAPQTPGKNIVRGVPLTPDTNPAKSPTKPTTPQHTSEAEPGDEFGWSSDADDEIVEVLEIYETPRKAARTVEITSPGKSAQPAKPRSAHSSSTLALSDDVFATPSTSHKVTSSGLLLPTQTPAEQHSQPLFQQDQNQSSLSAQALSILKPVNLNSTIENDLIALLDKYELRAQGIAKGRDISRLAVQAKDRKIADLQARIQALEAEKETSRTVISHLKHDIATSPKKGGGAGRGSRRSEGFSRTRSEV